ncbi:MAG TPA: hypothetical protein VGO67_15015 [Verrucomicrobiae bacterium]|jgi:hypothetical protein
MTTEEAKFNGEPYIPEDWLNAYLDRQASQPMDMSGSAGREEAGCSQAKSRNWLVAGMLAAFLLGALVSRGLPS